MRHARCPDCQQRYEGERFSLHTGRTNRNRSTCDGTHASYRSDELERPACRHLSRARMRCALSRNPKRGGSCVRRTADGISRTDLSADSRSDYVSPLFTCIHTYLFDACESVCESSCRQFCHGAAAGQAANGRTSPRTIQTWGDG